MDTQKIKDEVWRTVQEMNKTWAVDGTPEKLVDYFHEDMVAIVPSVKERIEGRDACIAGWKAFCDVAKIHYWKEIDPDVRIFGGGSFAVVSYYYDMSVDMFGQTMQMKGRDMFSLVKESGRWWAVSDQFSSFPG